MPRKQKQSESSNKSFEETYPHIAEWILTHGWIEIGQLEGLPAFAIALDGGGMVWEGKSHYKTLDDAFQALDEGIAKWMRREWGKEE